ncbi:MAG: FAD-binding protein [Desulfovibrio sp.]|jgi:succinate dehydrogenase / fumarate reductase flavoprotein subunit|nr:FAD-binding protein [Desulfovibrio sp.]
MAGNSELRFLQTDVVVAGGAGAGVTAALAAFRAGADVILVSKGKVGRSGNVVMAGGSLSVDGYSAKKVMGLEADESISPEGWFDSLVKEGFYLSDQPVVEQFTSDGPAIVKEYIQWAQRANVPFKQLKDGKWVSSGRNFALALKEGLRDAPGVEILEDTSVIDVLMRDGRPAGILALDIYRGELFVVLAKAVVLGTGGYQPFSLKNSVTDMTGDGVGIGFRAGADIADMEFLLSLPTAVAPPYLRGSILPYVLIVYCGLKGGAWPQFRDAHGDLIAVPEEIMEKTAFYKGFKLIKLVCTYYWGEAIFHGRGTKNGGIFLDYSRYTPKQREEAVKGYFSVQGEYYATNHYKGDDISRVMDNLRDGKGIETGLGFEYSCGGLLIDEHMRTTVPGIFAGGETGSGTFGAMRVGDGLVEMLVQGYKAGESAAAFARNIEPGTPDKESTRCCVERAYAPLRRKTGISPVLVQARIEKACDAGFGFRRTEAGLLAALKELRRIRTEDMPHMAVSGGPRYNIEWLTALQMENLMVCVEHGVLAALERKESRGNHIRDDYPQVDHDTWTVRQIFTPMADGGINMRKETPRVTKVPLLRGKDENVMQFFLRPDLDYKRYQWG